MQLYITPDPRRDHELGALLDPCNAVFAQYPLLVVPQEWHHVTVQPIAHVPAAQIRDEQRATFIANLGARLAAVPAWTWTMGSPLVSGRAVLLDTSPDKPFHRLLDTVRTAVADAFGPAPVSYDTSPAHIDTVLSPYRRRFHSRPGDTAEASAGAPQSCADTCPQGAARGRPAGRRAGVPLVGTRAHVPACGTGMIARSAVYG